MRTERLPVASSATTGRAEDGHDRTVGSTDRGDARHALDDAEGIAVGHQFLDVPPRDRERRTSLPDRSFAIRFCKKQHEVTHPHPPLYGSPTGVFADAIRWSPI